MKSLPTLSFSGRAFALARLLVLALAVTGPPAARAQGEYRQDGTPTAEEEELRWLINRGRFDPAGENARQKSRYRGLSARSGPLAPDQTLTRAARRHAEDMARSGVFQHATVPQSRYYHPKQQAHFTSRLKAEGGVFDVTAENLSAGRATAAATHAGWWHSKGHRQNMSHRDLRVLGGGHAFRQGSPMGHYWALDFGARSGVSFFTDTVFYDANGDGAYTQGEGSGGVRIELVAEGQPPVWHDVSTAVGSFAVPLQGQPARRPVTVFLVNTTRARLRVSLPREARGLETVTLAPGERRACGVFTFKSGASNVGFRHLVPAT